MIRVGYEGRDIAEKYMGFFSPALASYEKKKSAMIVTFIIIIIHESSKKTFYC